MKKNCRVYQIFCLGGGNKIFGRFIYKWQEYSFDPKSIDLGLSDLQCGTGVSDI
jgi:hypothetical protein